MRSVDPQARWLEEFLGKAAVWTTVFLGLLIVFLPLLPGWQAIKNLGEAGFVRVLVGFLFFYIAAMIKERYRLKSRFMDLMEAFDAFNSALYGKNFKVTREAVTYLVTSLASSNPAVREKAHALLVRMTGQEMGPDYEAWKDWWDKNRLTFTPVRSESGEARERSES